MCQMCSVTVLLTLIGVRPIVVCCVVALAREGEQAWIWVRPRIVELGRPRHHLHALRLSIAEHLVLGSFRQLDQ